MDSKEQHALNYCMTLIVDNMNVMSVVDHLRVILTNEEVEIIKAIEISQNQRRELIDILRRKEKQQTPFKRLLRALSSDRVGQGWLANEIQAIYNQEDKVTEFGRVTNVLLSGAEIDDALQNQAPSTSSIGSLQSSTEEWKQNLKDVQQSLKAKYLERFKTVYPFSLPFTFDIENTWVSLALKEDFNHLQATEDHTKLLQRAFEKAKMLIIEGYPATGKTSLMRRLAYEWAKGKQELLCYDLVLYAEFRKIHEKTFESIVDLVLHYSKTLLKKESYGKLEKLMNNEQFCEEHRILVLLDGYDESSLEKQCSELKTYLFQSMTDKALVINIIITTRMGYLSHLRGLQGRFVFAEVLGFTTKEQKEKYITNHFHSETETDKKESMIAVHHLLSSNENLNKLAETPLFLTFICLVHERIIDGTLVELYCNIIWWFIDRHQKNNLDHDVPALFGFQHNCSDKFEIIQDHNLQFPQIHYLGNMALCKLKENVFTPSDCAQFSLQPIIEQVGLLRKERKHDNSFKLATSFFFPHRTIQEFLAAFYCFCSNGPTSEWWSCDLKLNTSGINEFERFVLRIALSDKMPINIEKRKYYFERIVYIDFHFTFDALNTITGFNNKLLNWFISQCINVRKMTLRGELRTPQILPKFHAPPPSPLGLQPPLLIPRSPPSPLPEYKPEQTVTNSVMSNDTLIHGEAAITSNISCRIPLSFSDLMELHSVPSADSYSGRKFEASSQLISTNCPPLNNLQFNHCDIKSSKNLGIATLRKIESVEFYECNTAMATWQSITNQIRISSVIYLKLRFRKYYDKEFLINLQKCNIIEKMEITIVDYQINQNDLLSFSDLIKLHSLAFYKCTFEANSQLSFTNCPSLKDLKFSKCEMKSSTIIGIATLPAIDTVELYKCNIDLATWQSITDAIRNSSVKCLQLFSDCEFNKECLTLLRRCNNVEKMEITINHYTIPQNDLLSFNDLIKLQSLTLGSFPYGGYISSNITPGGCTFEANSQLSFTNCPSLKDLKFRKCEMKSNTTLGIARLPAIDTVDFCECTFEANSQLSFTNCPSLKDLIFHKCEMKSSTIIGIATLPAIDTVQFYECKIDLTAWQSITDAIRNSSVKFLQLFFNCEFNKECLTLLRRCNNVEKMEIRNWIYQISQNNLLSFNDLIKLHSLIFCYCTFEPSSQLSFTNCPSLKNLIFDTCNMKSSTHFLIATLPAIHTVKINESQIDLTTWQTITDQIRKSSVKYLNVTFGGRFFVNEQFREAFNKEFLIHLQKCSNVEKMEITISEYQTHQNDLLAFRDLIRLHSLLFWGCTFEADSQLSITNCSSLKNLEFRYCTMKSNTTLGIARLPAIDTVECYRCKIDFATWQSVTDQIRNCSVTYLKLSADYFVEESYPEFLHYLLKCECIQQIHVKDAYDFNVEDYIFNRYKEKVTANLAQTAQKLPRLKSIIISDACGRRLKNSSRLDESRRLKKSNKEKIEKAGQERNPEFLIKYAE